MSRIEQIKELFFIKFKDLEWEKIKAPNGKKHTIIFADDEKSFTDLVAEKLEKSGLYEVYPATNGQEALSYFTNIGADMVVTDIMMDTMTGIELGNRVLRKNEDQKIIFISGWIGEEVIKEKFSSFYKKGNLAFIAKPVTIDQLMREIYLSLNPEMRDLLVNSMDKGDLRTTVEDMEFESINLLYKAMRELFIDLSDRLLDKIIDQKSVDSILFPAKDYMEEKLCSHDESYCKSNLCTREDDSCAKDKIVRYILQLSTNLKYVFKTTISGDMI